ncbi:MAG: diguanylate cyclase [Clostridiales bacterium]|jgi:diguanylate cyclase (GGDEF)-like protein|nr:diguanylate cyclase [Clostridiales bacterium]
MENQENYSILIVDDERADILALSEILSRQYTIYVAKSADAALKLIQKNWPDLILLDVLMPEVSGFEMLARLKSAEDTEEIPVIFIAGLDNPKDEEQGFILGAVDYIKKPFISAIVKARVKTQIKIIHQMRVNEHLGMTDPLTGLANRRKFDEFASREWKMAIREHRHISFLMMDLDKFKTYNDTYGHPQGDTLLRAVSAVFMAAARRPLDLAARRGGEEFGVLLPDADAPNALSIAEKIRRDVEALRVPSASGDEITRTTISIGVISTAPQFGDDWNVFVAKADENLYRAKEGGRNRVQGA